MKPLKFQPGLTEQVYQRLLDEMSEGRLAPQEHLVQEQIAAKLGVSRQPVQQALALLKNDGLVQELGRRGLFVAPLDATIVLHRYDIRATLDGLAARRAALRVREQDPGAKDVRRMGEALLEAGHAAIARGGIASMVQCDIRFHEFVYEASANPLIAQTAAPHWRHLRRVMGEVLRNAEPPRVIWAQHQGILEAIVEGNAKRAEALAVAHVRNAAERLERALTNEATAPVARRPRSRGTQSR